MTAAEQDLRDRFAECALHALIPNARISANGKPVLADPGFASAAATILADVSYTVADAMMERRNQKP